MAHRGDNPYSEGAQPPHRSRDKNRSARIACDFFIVFDLLAAIAFIIAGLAPTTWINYTASTDNSTNSSYPSYYFTRYRTLFNICPNSVQAAVNSMGCSLLDLAPVPTVISTDYQYWNIISMRRVEIAFFIIAVILTGVALIVHGFCCIPHCRHEAGNGYWKNGIASGVLTGFAAAFQLIGMIVYQADVYYESTYSGINCVDCWGFWPSTVTSGTQVSFGVGYALCWCAAGLLVYGAIAYFSRELCVTRGCGPVDDNQSENDGISGNSDVILKGAARAEQFNQVSGTPHLHRHDSASAQQQSFYPNIYSRTDPSLH